MSNNVQTVLALYDAFRRGDIAFILSHLDENVIWESEGPAALSFSGIHRGLAGAMRFFEAIGNDHEVHSLSMPDVFSDGADRVAAFGRYEA